jgi:hypothetical protein
MLFKKGAMDLLSIVLLIGFVALMMALVSRWGFQVYRGQEETASNKLSLVENYSFLNLKRFHVAGIEPQSITEGDLFEVFDLDDFIYGIYSNVTWSYGGNSNFVVAINESNSVNVTYVSGFVGREEIIFTATDADGVSDSEIVYFRVWPS